MGSILRSILRESPYDDLCKDPYFENPYEAADCEIAFQLQFSRLCSSGLSAAFRRSNAFEIINPLFNIQSADTGEE